MLLIYESWPATRSSSNPSGIIESTSKGCFFAFLEKLKSPEFIKLGFAIYFQYTGPGRGRARLQIPAGSQKAPLEGACLLFWRN